jgi:hypothetical protein
VVDRVVGAGAAGVQDGVASVAADADGTAAADVALGAGLWVDSQPTARTAAMTVGVKRATGMRIGSPRVPVRDAYGLMIVVV